MRLLLVVVCLLGACARSHAPVGCGGCCEPCCPGGSCAGAASGTAACFGGSCVCDPPCDAARDRD